MRLLIVEDSELIRAMYALAFPSRDHEVLEAEHGQRALDLFHASPEPFDAILLETIAPLDRGGASEVSVGRPPW